MKKRNRIKSLDIFNKLEVYNFYNLLYWNTGCPKK